MKAQPITIRLTRGEVSCLIAALFSHRQWNQGLGNRHAREFLTGATDESPGELVDPIALLIKLRTAAREVHLAGRQAVPPGAGDDDA